MGSIQAFSDGYADVQIKFYQLEATTVPPDITNADIVEGGLTVNSTSTNSGMVEVGNANANEISITLENHDGRWDAYDYSKLWMYVSVTASDSTNVSIGSFIIDTVENYDGTATLHGLDVLARLDYSVTGGEDFTQPNFDVMSADCPVTYFPSKTTSPIIGYTGHANHPSAPVGYRIVELYTTDTEKWGKLHPDNYIVIDGADTPCGDHAWVCLTGYASLSEVIFPDAWGIGSIIYPPSVGMSALAIVFNAIRTPFQISVTPDALKYLGEAFFIIFELSPDITVRQLVADSLAVTMKNASAVPIGNQYSLDATWYDDDRDTDRCYTPSYVFKSHFEKDDITITGIDFTVKNTPYTVGTNGTKLTIPQSAVIDTIAYMDDGIEQLSVPDYIDKYKDRVIGFSYTPFDMRVLPCPIDRCNQVMYYGTESGGVYTIDKVCAVTDWTWTLHGGTNLQGRGDILDYEYATSDTLANTPKIDTALSEYSNNPVENRVITDALNKKAEIVDIASGEIGGESIYNSRFVNWVDGNGDITNLSISSDGKTLSINRYTASTDTWATLGTIDISKGYLPLSGGNMTGDIYMTNDKDIHLESAGSRIYQALADTSNYGTILSWYNTTLWNNSFAPHIGMHNVNNRIIILPYSTDTQPYASGNPVGFVIDQAWLKHEGNYVGRFTATPTSGRILTSDGTTGGMQTSGFSFTETTSTASLSFGGGTATLTARKKGNVVYFDVSIGNSSKFTSATSGDSLGTLPSGYRPSAELYIPIAMRTSGTWASATYYPCYLRIETSGVMRIYGNTTNIRACTNIRGYVSFPV